MLWIVEFFTFGKYRGRMLVEASSEQDALSKARQTPYCETLRGSTQDVLVRLFASRATGKEVALVQNRAGAVSPKV